MATHSSILVWKIPWTEEPGRLQFTGSQSWTQLKRLSLHTHGCLPSASTRIKSYAAAAADLQHLLKEFRVESRNQALCTQGKTGSTGLQIDILRSRFYELSSCISSYLEKLKNLS